MKTCPKCRAQFGDEMSFCLHDGTLLLTAGAVDAPTAQYGEKTFELPQDVARPTQAPDPDPGERPTAESYREQILPYPVQPKRSHTKYILPLILVCLVGIAAIAAAGIGLALYIRSRPVEVSIANSNSVERMNTNSLNNNTDQSLSNSTSPNTPSNIFANNTPSNIGPTPSSTPRTKTPTPTPKRDSDDLTEVDDVPLSSTRPTPRPNVPKTIAGGVLNGKAISLPRPPYPPAARAVRASGAVSVQVLIDENGRVISASAVSGHPLLRASAVSAARGARFTPTILSGQAVKVSGVITYNFVP
jgi:TonB family protein